MKVLVIGGAGYIGSHVVRALLDAGNTVTVFDNLSSGSEGNLFKEATFFKGDILTSSDLAKAMAQGFDGMVHLAAFKAAGESMTNPEKYSVNNITGTLNIINAACAADIKNMVFSSSAAVYGEPQYCPIDEAHPVNPENYYGFTKLEIERFLAWYDKLKSLRYAALRYFNAAGYDPQGRISGLERNPANLLPIVMEAAIGMRDHIDLFGNDYATPDGTCIRDYVHVSDLANAHVAALNHISTTNTSLLVNLGSEVGISVTEMIDVARKITGKPIPVVIKGRRAGDPAKLVASAKKAHEVLNFKAQHSSVESLIETTWKVYLANNK